MLSDHRFREDRKLGTLLGQVREKNTEGVWAGKTAIRERGWGEGGVVREGRCAS